MTPLEYLVPSRHRREMLKALRSERGGLSVRQLARRVGVAYSNAHREVGRLRRTGLLSVRRVGNALLCRWKTGNPLAKALNPLFLDVGKEIDEQTLYGNLRQWGAPLVRNGTSGRKLSLEETLGHALALSRRHPEVARAWPVVFAKNWPGVKLGELEEIARRLGQRRTLGFFLTLAGSLLEEAPLARYARRLRDRRITRVEEFFLLPRGGRARRLADRHPSGPAREWCFRMNMPMESFESLFRKCVGAHEVVQR